MKYEKYKKKSDDKSSVWHYFLRAQDGQSGKCNMCEAIRKCAGGSTTGLSLHLKSAHQIDIKKATVVNTPTNEPSTSSALPQVRVLQPIQQNTETSAQSLTSLPKKRKITEYFESSNSMETTISRMTALDGIPFSKFCTSKDLRRVLLAAGYNRLPSTPKSIKNIVINYSKKEKKKLVEEIKAMRKAGVKFSLTFDEWTSLRNRRYMNVNLHTAIGSEFQDGSLFKNIGLVRVDGTMPAETCIMLLKTKLLEFELSLDRDIVAITTDGASVMCKVGRNIEAFHQICLAHGIHLGVSDVLYRKATTTESTEHDENETSDDDESEDEDGDNETFTFIEVLTPRFNLEYGGHGGVIKKTRSVIKMFLRSPTKNDALQKYVREQEGRDLALVLDCKTRWSSLADMIERFNRLKTCIEKTLIDFNSAIKFSQEEFALLHSIQKSLKIVKITVEALCRRDATLLTAEAALKYMLRKLDNQGTSLSKSLAEALRKRISERRQPMTAVLQYLHNPEEYFKENAKTLRVNHPEFPRMSCDEMITSIAELVQRLQEQTLHSLALQNTSAMSSPAGANAPAEKETSDDDTGTGTTGSSNSSVMEIELNKAIEKSMTKKQNRPQIGEIGEEEEDNIKTLIRIEMTLHENGGTRGRFLDAAYKYLLSIPPTSVESERAFSAASYICNKIRSSLDDASLDALCFLRSIFQQTRSA